MMNGIENFNCFRCKKPGHLERDCPEKESAENRKPPWCGICDPVTRLAGLGPDGPMARCGDCHPLRGQLLKQHRRCPACKMVIHSWDNKPCGFHSSPAITIDRRPSRDRIDSIAVREGLRDE
jgi:hypothetical protein